MSFTQVRLKLLKETIATYIVEGYDYDRMIEFLSFILFHFNITFEKNYFEKNSDHTVEFYW